MSVGVEGNRAAKKRRQRKRRLLARHREKRQHTNTLDKTYAMGVLSKAKKTRKVPHLQWKDGSFTPTPPASPPTVEVEVTMMQAAHEKLGIKWEGSRQGMFNAKPLPAIADTGCQTCVAGTGMLDALKCPPAYMIPTSHKIMGITAASLGIVGAILLRIELNGHCTRQMVYVSERISGFFLSETALKELGIIGLSFPTPHPQDMSSASATDGLSPVDRCLDDDSDDMRAILSSMKILPCGYPERTATPDHPSTVPYTPTKENVPKVKSWLLAAFTCSGFNVCNH